MSNVGLTANFDFKVLKYLCDAGIKPISKAAGLVSLSDMATGDFFLHRLVKKKPTDNTDNDVLKKVLGNIHDDAEATTPGSGVNVVAAEVAKPNPLTGLNPLQMILQNLFRDKQLNSIDELVKYADAATIRTIAVDDQVEVMLEATLQNNSDDSVDKIFATLDDARMQGVAKWTASKSMVDDVGALFAREVDLPVRAAIRKLMLRTLIKEALTLNATMNPAAPAKFVSQIVENNFLSDATLKGSEFNSFATGSLGTDSTFLYVILEFLKPAKDHQIKEFIGILKSKFTSADWQNYLDNPLNLNGTTSTLDFVKALPGVSGSEPLAKSWLQY